jgi:isoaspartyl peptidase/L-asparaginase-like protein (Ntn-hydrolase superfamily)
MNSRRDFLKLGALAGTGLIVPSSLKAEENSAKTIQQVKPIVVSTWNHGLDANKAAWKVLKKGGSSLDAVEQGVRVIESDPENTSVGIGGRPDRDGVVSLDACIMDHTSNCGSVAYLQNIENPISVARKVMEDTPHVMLAGDGALQFAKEKGFKEKNLLTKDSEAAWKNWLNKSEYEPVINVENHDTIGMLAIDAEGNISGSCTTSGMAYKLHGRVGDSPIIGAGLFLDNEVGGCCATGMGEAIIRVAGSSVVVEMMRNGMSPQEACDEAVARIMKKHKSLENLQCGFLALDKAGNVGASSVYAGFDYALKTASQEELINAEYKLEWE